MASLDAGRCPLSLRVDIGVGKGSPEVMGRSGFWPVVQLLGWYLGRVFGNKEEIGPDLHHGKSELWAKWRGGGWAAGWEGLMVKRTLAAVSPETTGVRVLWGVTPRWGAWGPSVQAPSPSLARWLRGRGEGKPLARKGEVQTPQCVLPQSPVWRPALASCPPTRPPPSPRPQHGQTLSTSGAESPLSDNK